MEYWIFWLLVTWFVVWSFSKTELSFDWLRRLIDWVYLKTTGQKGS